MMAGQIYVFELASGVCRGFVANTEEEARIIAKDRGHEPKALKRIESKIKNERGNNDVV